MSNTTITDGHQTPRIEFIDAMRGLIMVLVVCYHVALYCFHTPNNVASVHPYLMQMLMPLFFFISGFVFFRAGTAWGWRQTTRFLSKKIPVLVVAPLLFFAVFVYIQELSWTASIGDHYKKGYWFTLVLFEYYLFYIAFRCIFRNGKAGDAILILTGLVLYFIDWSYVPIPGNIQGALCMPNWNKFLFFVLGALARKNEAWFGQLLDTKWALAVCILYYFLMNAFLDAIQSEQLYCVIRLGLSLTAIAIMFAFFRKKQPIFSKGTVMGDTLQYIGRRTLDVYLIHYFLVPRNLSFVTVFTDHPMPVVELTVSMLIAVVIVAACLLIGNIFRLSPLLAHWLFGAQYPSSK